MKLSLPCRLKNAPPFSPKPKAKVGRELEAVGTVFQQDTRTGKDGKTYKARKPIRYTLIDEYDAAQADALAIECRAKIRLADEYDAAQKRGEVARLGDSQHHEGVEDGNTLSTAADLGLRRDEIHSSRQLRDAAAAFPGLVQRVVDAAIGCGQEPTRARLYRQVKDITKAIRAGEQAIKRAARDAHNRLLRLATTATLCCPRPGSSRTRRPQ